MSQAYDEQYLTFALREELFALPVRHVREILDAPALTRIPQTPGFVAGVINLRGQVVPVIDLRQRFGLPLQHAEQRRCIVVMEVTDHDGAHLFGALVDGVHEVVPLEPDKIVAPPQLGSRLPLEFLAGIGMRNDRFILVLKVMQLLTADEFSQLHPAPAPDSLQ